MAISPEQFAAQLLIAAAAAPVAAAAVVTKGAQNIKTTARANVQRSAPVHNAGAYRAINYDPPTISATGAQTEVGYDLENRSGRLGNLLEYGGGGDHSPPHRDIGRAADEEEDRFLNALGDAGWKLL